MSALAHAPKSTFGDNTVVDGRYELIRRLGQGGMGVVYEAHDRASGRRCALKALVHKDEARPSRKRRAELLFRREFHTMAHLRHPRIVEAYEYGVDVLSKTKQPLTDAASNNCCPACQVRLPTRLTAPPSSSTNDT